ncbi:MAG: hypothetical protein ABL973_00510 [Micropepsaceae bacterium]
MDATLPPELASESASGSLKVVRHTFGGKAAAGVLIVMLAVAAALGQYLMAEPDPFPQLPESPKFQPTYNIAPASMPPVVETDAAPAANPPAPNPEAELERVMDASFQRINTSDISSVNQFLDTYGKHERAIRLGFVEKAEGWRDTLMKLDAEAEAETRRKQKSVPWDME